MPEEGSALQALEKSASDRSLTQYLLRLFITGTTPNSSRAVANIRKICEEHLPGRYELEVIDLCERPEMATGEQIIAAPTLIRKLPLPLRRFIGDMSQTDRLIVGLEIKQPSSAAQ